MNTKLSIYWTSGIMPVMTIIKWLVENMKKLQRAGVDSPRRDCLVFLEDTLSKERAWVITNPEYHLNSEQIKKLAQLINQRLKRKPLAYIRGKAWFYGRFFEVTPNVLIPRPESEGIIELLKKLADNKQLIADKLKIFDIGTGSGCLAITAKLEFPEAEVIATDIDKEAMKVAKLNALRYKANVAFITSDLLTSVSDLKSDQIHSKNVIILIVNLPYVPDEIEVSPEIFFEPPQALFSGKDGLAHYQRFWVEISKLSSYPQYILTESLETQHMQMTSLAEQAGYSRQLTEDLVQCFIKIEPRTPVE